MRWSREESIGAGSNTEECDGVGWNRSECRGVHWSGGEAGGLGSSSEECGGAGNIRSERRGVYLFLPLGPMTKLLAGCSAYVCFVLLLLSRRGGAAGMPRIAMEWGGKGRIAHECRGARWSRKESGGVPNNATEWGGVDRSAEYCDVVGRSWTSGVESR